MTYKALEWPLLQTYWI